MARPVKALVNEQCGDGIMSAIDFYLDVGTTAAWPEPEASASARSILNAPRLGRRARSELSSR